MPPAPRSPRRPTRTIALNAFRALAVGVLALGPLAGCGRVGAGGPADPDVADTTRQAFNAARARWAAAGPARYALTYDRVCFCPEEVRGPFVVTVEGGRAVRVERRGAPAGAAAALTVDSLFATLARAFDSGADAVRARYDARYGYPIEVYIDHETMAADEETGFNVTAFTPR